MLAGKYGEDFGWVAETSNPYSGSDGKCHTPASAPRYYATKYRYVGGYYGACSEEVLITTIYCNLFGGIVTWGIVVNYSDGRRKYSFLYKLFIQYF